MVNSDSESSEDVGKQLEGIRARRAPNPAEIERRAAELLRDDDASTDGGITVNVNEILAPDAAAATATTPRASPTNKRRLPMSTTARGSSSKKKKRQKKPQIKHGCRVKIQKRNLFQLCTSDQQRALISSQAQNRLYYGTITSGNASTHYIVAIDEFPMDDNKIKARRNVLTVVHEDEEEKMYEYDKVVDSAAIPPSDGRTSRKNKSVVNFLYTHHEALKDTKHFHHYYGEGDSDFVDWKILGDTEHIGEDQQRLEFPTQLQYKKDLPYDPENDGDFDYNHWFFEEFFPCIKGHAAKMDKYLNDPRSSYHITAQRDNIKFYQPNAPWHNEDPDHLIRICYTLLLAAATEVHHGVDNLWKAGQSSGRHDYPDFGKYIPKNYFKAFLSAAAYCWCEEKHWYMPQDEGTWDIFKPCLQSFNDKRRSLVKTVLLLLDESMSGWRPKTSKLGGLPNYTYEPRKPVSLGTMLRNGVECICGMLVFQDVVQLPEHQSAKKYHGEESVLPNPANATRKKTISSHTAEVLRQVEGAGLEEGAWVGGDAWFGSVATAVEVYSKFKVHSTFIIKNNDDMYPMRPLLAVLKARYPERAAGHWVTMTATIGGVPLIAMVYAWSSKGTSFFLSTCGRTDPHPEPYRSSFVDDYGVVTHKELQRPHLAHFLYDFLPLIGEHNKQRQSILQLERVWKTKNCWMRLVTTLLGMSVVDFQRYIRNRRATHMIDDRDDHQHSSLMTEDDDDDDDDLKIRWFSDRICKWLDTIPTRQRATPRLTEFRPVPQQGEDDLPILERITDTEGRVNLEPTIMQIRAGRLIGKNIQLNCMVCRRYLNQYGKTTYNVTTWWCRLCHMPLCKKDRKGSDSRRQMSCLEEHFNSHHNSIMCCGEVDPTRNHTVPKEIQQPWPRRGRSSLN